jgi:hypothetical protein
MKPGLSGGDLVVVRSADGYAAGDVVAYRSPVANRTFVHRILRTEEGRFVLKGDANPYPDAGRPEVAAIDGKLWFSVPFVGSALGWLGVPMHAALVGGLLVLLLSGGGGAAAQRRKRRHRGVFPAEAPQPAPTSLETPSGAMFSGRWVTNAMLVTGVAALAIAALGLIAFSRAKPRRSSTARCRTAKAAHSRTGPTCRPGSSIPTGASIQASPCSCGSSTSFGRGSSTASGPMPPSTPAVESFLPQLSPTPRAGSGR